jgi:pilus assembly protein CpaB
MRAKSVLLLMLALGCGLVASIGITQVMANKDSDVQTAETEMTQIFVARVDIPTRDLITAKMLKLEEWPKGKVPKGAMSKLENVEERRPKSKIYAGAPILQNQLLDKGLSQDATGEIPPGYRVVSVQVNQESGTEST